MNFSRIKLAVVTPIVAFLVTACGGSDVVSRSYSELSSDAEQLGQRLEKIGQYNATTDDLENVTQTSELPTTGSASYSGVSEMRTGDSASQTNSDFPDVLSNLNLTADFASSTISGRMDNFQASTNNVQVSGSVDIINGAFVTVSGGEAGMTADLDGELAVTKAGVTDMVGVSGGAIGTFVGDTGEGLVGITSGDLTTSQGTSGFIGIWGAVRN